MNDDQLSLAIGKRGQNVRLAARLTGWDVDILTPPEFQAGVERLDKTLKALEIPQETVDKIIALGLIDVRDIEEVGEGPLMEELGMEEALATTVVERCSEEAKLVAVEQEAKKAAEAKARTAANSAAAAEAAASRNALLAIGEKGVDAEAFANPLLAPAGVQRPDDETAADNGASDRLPGAMEATEGSAPEVTTHSAAGLGGSGEDLSPEERAISGIVTDANAGPKEIPDEDATAPAYADEVTSSEGDKV